MAIHTDPDILLVDEVLAVGDEAFAHKCLRRIEELLADGKTVLMVSHALALIEEMCDRVLWLEKGGQRMLGEPRRVVDAYRMAVAEQEGRQHLEAKEEREREFDQAQEEREAELPAALEESGAEPGEVGLEPSPGSDPLVELDESDESAAEPETSPERWGSREAVVRRVRLLDSQGVERYHFDSGETVVFEIGATARHELDDFVFGIGISTPRGVECWGTNTDLAGFEPGALRGDTVVRLTCPALRLAAGEYLVDVAVHARDGAPYDYHRRHLSFSVTASTVSVGLYRPEHRWEFDDSVQWDATPTDRG